MGSSLQIIAIAIILHVKTNLKQLLQWFILWHSNLCKQYKQLTLHNFKFATI